MWLSNHLSSLNSQTVTGVSPSQVLLPFETGTSWGTRSKAFETERHKFRFKPGHFCQDTGNTLRGGNWRDRDSDVYMGIEMLREPIDNDETLMLGSLTIPGPSREGREDSRNPLRTRASEDTVSQEHCDISLPSPSPIGWNSQKPVWKEGILDNVQNRDKR